MKLGVIGVGNMGKNHARIYSEMKGVELVGISDSNPETGMAVAKKYGSQYESYRDFVNMGIDAVSIATPTINHYEVAKYFLQGNIDVLLEKPITASVDEAEALITLARDNDCILQVGHVERFNPVVAYLTTHIEPSKVISLETRRLGTSARITDVGVVLDLMIHDIDIVRSLIGQNIKKCSVSKDVPSKENYAVAVLEFEGGAIATLTASRTTQRRERVITITEADKYTIADYMNQTIEVHKKATADQSAGGWMYSDIVERPQIVRAEPLKLELESFVNSVKTRKPPIVDGLAGKLALETAIKIQNGE